MEDQMTTKVEELSRAFIEELNRQNFALENLQYVQLGPVADFGDLQRVRITASPAGWIMFNHLKNNWGVK